MQEIITSMSSLEQTLSYLDCSTQLENIEQTLGSIADSIQGIGAHHTLDMEQIQVRVVEPLLGISSIYDAKHDALGVLTVCFISGVTIDRDDDPRPVLYEDRAFLEPHQWVLLRGAHPLELQRWFAERGKKTIRHASTHRGFHDVTYKITKVTKQCPRADEIVLEFHWKFKLAPEFYFGYNMCQGAAHSIFDRGADYGGPLVRECALDGVRCGVCSKRLLCEVHKDSIGYCLEHPGAEKIAY